MFPFYKDIQNNPMKPFFFALTGLCTTFLHFSSVAIASEMTHSQDLEPQTQWQLIQIEGQRPLNSRKITAQFTDEQLSGSAGCNRYHTSYQQQEQHLTLGLIAVTRMACEPEIMRQESQYLMALRNVQTYEINSRGELRLFYTQDEQSGVLVFAPEQPLQSLDQTYWELTSKNGVSPLAGLTLTAEFEGERVTGFTGCNYYVGFAIHTPQRDRLTLRSLAWTQRACPGEVMAQEVAFLAALAQTKRYEVNTAGQLVLFYEQAGQSGQLILIPQSLR